jgi:hypothetical protein
VPQPGLWGARTGCPYEQDVSLPLRAP